MTRKKSRFWVRKQKKYKLSEAEEQTNFVNTEDVNNYAVKLGYTIVNGKNEFVLLSGSTIKRRLVLDIQQGALHMYVYGSCFKTVESADLTTEDVNANLLTLSKGKHCVGNNDQQFLELSLDSKTAYLEKEPYETIRHVQCSLFLENSERCPACQKYRGTLRKKVSSNKAKLPAAKVDASSHTPLAVLSKPELMLRCQNLAAQHKSDSAKLKALRAKIEKSISKNGIQVSEETGRMLQTAINNELLNGIENMNPVKRLFLEQQIKQASCKSANGMRWHPTVIRWCLAMRRRSTSGYEFLRSTTTSLPHSSVLNDYAQYRECGTGIDYAGIAKLAEQYGECDIAVLCDEMKVKDGLVYERNTGKLVGYADIDVESALSTPPGEQQIATHALVFMIRGLKTNLKLSAASYATTTATAEQIYVKFWELVGALELYGFRVRCFIADGASTNRRFIQLHSSDYPDDPITHRAVNLYHPDRDIYFVSDVPHLVKTTRNNYENSGANLNTRRLILNGKAILWSDISTLFDEMTYSTCDSFQMLHKLTHAHVKLTPFSRMKVLYATQVLSKSVANALRMKSEEKFDSSIQFIEKVNDAFDILNIRYKDEGQRSRNKFKMVLASPLDWRFEWIQTEFLDWLSGWEKEINDQDISEMEKSRCLLSKATRDGWRITCYSFMALGKTLLNEGYQFLLTEKLLCQDSLEQYFGHQRAGTGSNNAPTMSEFVNSSRLITITQEAEAGIAKGNCTRLSKDVMIINDEPLPKRKRK